MLSTAALLVVSLLAPGIASGQSPPAPESRGASQAPMADLGKGAEEVAAQLRQLTESLSDTAAVASLEAKVAATTHRAAERWRETGVLLEGNLRPAALDSLESSWNALRSQLSDLRAEIDARVRRRTGDLETLTRLRVSWGRALDLAETAAATAAVFDRAKSTTAATDAARQAVEQRPARMLVLQDSVSGSLQTCDDARDRIDDARRQAIERAFVRQLPPVWRTGLASPGGGAGLTGDLATKADNIRLYAQAYSLRLVLSGLIVLLCVILLRRGRVQPARRAGREGGPRPGAAPVQAPSAAGRLLWMVLSVPLRPKPPFAFQQLLLVINTIAAVFVLRAALSARLTPVLYAGATLLVLNIITTLLDVPAGLEQVILVVELGAMAALLLWAAVRLGPREESASYSPRLRAVTQGLLRLLALGCGAAALAAAAGYTELAAYLGVGLFYAVFVAFVAAAVRVVVEDVMTIGLARGPVARLHAVARHRALIERRTRPALDVLTGCR